MGSLGVFLRLASSPFCENGRIDVCWCCVLLTQYSFGHTLRLPVYFSRLSMLSL